MEQKVSALRWRVSLCVSLGIWFGVYLSGAATTFQPADSAEFLTVAATAGVAHPPGYPLYVWLGWLAIQLLPLSIPLSLAVLAATLSSITLLGVALTLASLHKQARPEDSSTASGLSMSQRSGLVGLWVAGTSLHIWKHATHPEVFALLGCLAVWLCYWASQVSDGSLSPTQRGRAWLIYALLAGLASAHHQTIIFTFPVGLWLLYHLMLSQETRLASSGWWFLGGVGCFVLGLSPFLHLVWRGTDLPVGSWGHFATLKDVWEHMIRKEFGTFQSGIYKSERPFWFHSLHYLLRAFSWKGTFPLGLSILWILGMVMPVLAWRHRGQGDRSQTWPLGAVAAFGGAWFLAGLVFPCLLLMGTSALDQYVAARFFLLPDVFLCLFAGGGAIWLLRAAEERGATAQRLVQIALGAWFVAALIFQYPHGASHHRRWMQTYTEDMLRELPKDAVLLEAHNEAICFGVTYLQQMKRLRRDVKFVCLPMMARRWYVEKMKKRWPDLRYQWDPKRISSLLMIRDAVRQGRSVHVTELYNRSIQVSFRWLPYGLSWQLWDGKKRPPAPGVLERKLLERFAAYGAQAPLPDVLEAPWPSVVLARYGNPWLALAGVFRRMGQNKAASRCHKRALYWQRKPPR